MWSKTCEPIRNISCFWRSLCVSSFHFDSFLLLFFQNIFFYFLGTCLPFYNRLWYTVLFIKPLYLLPYAKLHQNKKTIRLQYGRHQPFSYEKFGDIKRAIRIRNMKKKDLWTKHYSQNIAKKNKDRETWTPLRTGMN